MKITRWSPDTCECVIEYEWDETLSQDDRVHTQKKIINTCADHVGVTDTLYTVLDFETRRKNQLQGWILENLSNVSVEKTDENTGEIRKVFKPKIIYDWNFEGNGADRILHARLLGIQLSNAEKTTIQDFADTKFGMEKIVVT